MSELEDSADHSAAASTSRSAPKQQPTQHDDDDDVMRGDEWEEQFRKLFPKFAGLADIDLRIRPTKYDFRDDELMNRPGIRLDRYTDDEIAKLGRKVIPMVSTDFSQQGAAAILVLAYHLRSPGTDYKHYVFTDGDRYTTISDKKYDDFSDEVMTAIVQGPAKPISMASPINDSAKAKEAALYSYIAASMLRLFAKPAASYVKAWNRIIEGFPKSYGKSVNMFTMRALLPTTPNVESMQRLANWFTGSFLAEAKVTLYRLLHMSNSNQEHAGLKRFLYDMHLSYTGLHVVHMLFEICKVLSCSPSEVVGAINDTWETKHEVTSLKHVLELHADDGDKHKRRMWRYGRLFDVEFMAYLQTKTCCTLAYTFAEALKSEAPEDYSGMLEITELKRVAEPHQKTCAAAAQQLLRKIKASKT